MRSQNGKWVRVVQSSRKDCLDFIVPGAQKCGTTALHEYLRPHPRIAMPAGKEAPFFNKENYAVDEFETFLLQHYPQARPDQIWGKISPQYMTSEAIVDRIASRLPAVKIIASLRDPLDRAISHYRQALRRGYETRPIDTAFMEALERPAIAQARLLSAAQSSETRCYLAWGEYGRILEYYLTRYPRNQILIVFAEDLLSDPSATMDRVLEFIGLEPGYRLANLGKKIFAGANALRYPWLKPLAIRLGLDKVLQRLPLQIRNRLRLRYKLYSERTTPGTSRPIHPSQEVAARLLDFYRSDVELLRRSFGIQVPWPRFSREWDNVN